MRPVICCFGLGAALMGIAQAQPLEWDAPPAELRAVPFSPYLPGCGDPVVRAEIERGFSDRERSFWASALAMDAWLDARELGYRSHGVSFVPRRYCTALVKFNDGALRRVGYDIGQDSGFAGFGWGVRWCVVGLDRDFSFAPDCRMIEP